jgi:hypothetical protein
MRIKSVAAISYGSILFLGLAAAFGQTPEQAKTHFLAACMVSAQLDDPLGSEAFRNSFCNCRVEALKAAHSPAQIDEIAAYIEEGNGTVVPQATPLVGLDLSANQSTEEACRAGLQKR